MVNVTENDCRMRFGKPLIFDNSGENLTRGISMQLKSSIYYDPGVPIYC